MPQGKLNSFKLPSDCLSDAGVALWVSEAGIVPDMIKASPASALPLMSRCLLTLPARVLDFIPSSRCLICIIWADGFFPSNPAAEVVNLPASSFLVVIQHELTEATKRAWPRHIW